MRDQIREAKLNEANIICSLARIKWLGYNDEPKKLFFTLLKAKQQQELMSILITDSGESIVGEEAILQEVARFYTTLFRSKGESTAAQEARRELLRYTTVRVIEAQWTRIEGIPTREEIRKVLRKMQKEKSPGLDGMTIEVLAAC